MDLVDLQEKANFTRFTRLLVDKGTEALRNTFDTIHPPVNLPGVLAKNKTSLQKLKPGVIDDSQWDLLFPPSGNPPDSKTFDVTLLTVLFRNICGFPLTGWSVMPPDTDRSMQANIVRIKNIRNKIYAHATSTRIDDTRFQYLWQKISQALVELGIPQSDIEEIETAPLGPEEESAEFKKNEAMHIAIQHTADGLARHAEKSDREILLKLSNHKFDKKIDNLARLFPPGKGGLLREIDRWFGKIDSERVALLAADSSSCKTAFAAKVCQRFKDSNQLAACFFCNSNLEDPMVMLECLASQMCDNVPNFRSQLLHSLKRSHQVDSLKAAFQVFFRNPLDNLKLDEPVLLVLDGLNEISSNGKDEMIDLISDYFQELPKYIKMLMTTTPEDALENLSAVKKIGVVSKDTNNCKKH